MSNIKLILTLLCFSILFTAKGQLSNDKYRCHSFQAIDEAFVLTGLDSQIIEVTNRVEYLVLKESKLISFAYCKNDAALLTVEDMHNERILVWRVHDADDKQQKHKFQFPKNELPYKLKECDGSLVVITYAQKKSHVYALDKGKPVNKLFSVNAFVNDLFFNRADSLYYFCSGASVFKCRAGGAPEKIFTGKEKICRVFMQKAEMILSTSSGIYSVNNNQLKLAYNRGGYFDVLDQQLFIWDAPLMVTRISQTNSILK